MSKKAKDAIDNATSMGLQMFPKSKLTLGTFVDQLTMIF